MVQLIASRLQTCTVCYCTEYCRQLYTMVKYNIILYYIILYYIILYYIILYYIILYYIILYYIYYNLVEPPSYVRSVVDRNVFMRRIPVFADTQHSLKHYMYPIQTVSEPSQIEKFIENLKKKWYTNC